MARIAGANTCLLNMPVLVRYHLVWWGFIATQDGLIITPQLVWIITAPTGGKAIWYWFQCFRKMLWLYTLIFPIINHNKCTVDRVNIRLSVWCDKKVLFRTVGQLEVATRCTRYIHLVPRPRSRATGILFNIPNDHELFVLNGSSRCESSSCTQKVNVDIRNRFP